MARWKVPSWARQSWVLRSALPVAPTAWQARVSAASSKGMVDSQSQTRTRLPRISIGFLSVPSRTGSGAGRPVPTGSPASCPLVSSQRPYSWPGRRRGLFPGPIGMTIRRHTSGPAPVKTTLIFLRGLAGRPPGRSESWRHRNIGVCRVARTACHVPGVGVWTASAASRPQGNRDMPGCDRNARRHGGSTEVETEQRVTGGDPIGICKIETDRKNDRG